MSHAMSHAVAFLAGLFAALMIPSVTAGLVALHYHEVVLR